MALSKIDADGLNIGQIGGRRNLIINGAMQVAQRGTSVTGVTSTGYRVCDRWLFNTNQATWTVSQESDAPSGSGLSKSQKYLVTTAKTPLDASGLVLHTYKIEGQDLAPIAKGSSGAKSFTVSFWVKSNKTGTYVVEFYDSDNSRRISKSYTIDAADTWEQKTITVEGDTSGALTLDNSASINFQWALAAGSTFTSTGTLGTTWAANSNGERYVGQVNVADATNNYWQITGVQLEVGDTATPFEHRSYGEELALCQRYYVQWTGATGNNYIPIANGVATNTTISDSFAHLPVPMRANPSCSYSGNIYGFAGSSSLTLSSVNGNYGGDTIIYLNLHHTGGSWTVGQSVVTYTQNASTAQFYFDAEL